MSYDKCPNCGGTTSISLGKAICDYCGSEFAIETNSNCYANGGETPAQRLFDLSNIKNFDNEHGQKSFEEMCAWINAGDTVESCLDGLKNIAKEHNDWAMEDVNISLLDKAKKQLGNSLPTDEQILFFKDSGIIANGKSGVLITNKSIICFAKKNSRRLAISDIYSIHALAHILNNGKWYFNANKDLEIDNMACSPVEHGLIMALVCLLVQRYKGFGFKIKVYKGVL